MDILGSETQQQQQQPFGATPVLSRCRASMSSLLLLSLPGTNGKRGETNQAVLSMVSSSSFFLPLPTCMSICEERHGMQCTYRHAVPQLSAWMDVFWVSPDNPRSNNYTREVVRSMYVPCLLLLLNLHEPTGRHSHFDACSDEP